MVRFQMVGSESKYTIAEVISETDIEAFRKDPGWYEIKEEEKPAKKTQPKGE